LSLILDALNRSRQDSEPVPGLATRHDADGVQAPAPWRQYLPWSALLVAVAIIALLLFERWETAPEPVAGLAPVPAPQEEPVSAGKRSAAPAPAAQLPREPEVVPAPVAPAEPVAPPDAPVPAAAESGPAALAPAAPVHQEVAQLYQQPPAGAPTPADTDAPAGDPAAASDTGEDAVAPLSPAREEQQVDIDQMLRQAQEEMENARLAEHSAPFITELSQQTKNAIPTVYYQRHDYTGVAASSRVVLNGKSLGEGGSPAPGMKVVEILPDSVVMNYRGTEFRLRALNSWINL
jgi:hypothetical protein